MGNKFVGNPEVLRAKGAAIIEQAQQFLNNVNKVYSTIEEMITGDYLSPEARVIASQIESHHDDLNNMAQVMADYGTYCSDAGSTIVSNQENIASSVKIGN